MNEKYCVLPMLTTFLVNLTTLSIILGIIGVIFNQIGFVIQKLGVHILFTESGPLFNNKDFWTWVLGTLLTTVSAIIVFIAISIGQISIVQSLTGFGPVVIAILVTFYFKEKLLPIEWFALFISSVGVIFLSLASFSVGTSEHLLDEQDFFLVSTFLIGSILIFGWFLKNVHYLQLQPGFTEGIISGLIGGFPSLFAKLAIANLLSLHIFHWSIFALIGTQIIAFLLLQKGFHLASNIAIVVNLFTSMSILLPVVLAIVFYNEKIVVLQLVGVLLLLVADIFLGTRVAELKRSGIE